MGIERVLISGLSGSGKTTLAKRLSYIYGWEVHSVGEIFRRRWADQYPNSEISFEEYWARINTQDNLLMNNHAREFFEKRNVILESRYSEHYKDIEALFVFVRCNLMTRAMRCKDKYRGMDTREIIEILRRREEDEINEGKRMYWQGYDFRDPSHYDVVLDSSSMSLGEEVKAVRRLIESGKRF